jgi:hypothetical protein
VLSKERQAVGPKIREAVVEGQEEAPAGPVEVTGSEARQARPRQNLQVAAEEVGAQEPL